MQSKSLSKQYYAVDLVKFLCSILVVMIHISPTVSNGTFALITDGIRNIAARVAVPFFFVSGGFFLYKKSTYEDFDIKPTKNYVLKILRLYIIWTIIYLPLSIERLIGNKNGIVHGIFGYARDFLLVGSYRHLWYLNATIAGVIIVSFLLYKRCKIKNIVIISSVLYAFGLLAESWFGLLRPVKSYLPAIWSLLKMMQKVFTTTRNGLFEGFLFIAIGMIFAFAEIKIEKKKAVIAFIISFAMLFAEGIFVTHFNLLKSHDMYIFLVPTTFFLFYIVKNTQLKSSGIYIILRKLSSLIFYMHLWVEKIVSYLSLKLFEVNIDNTYLELAATLAVTILISAVIIRLSEYNSFRWLKKLYV